jgi:hypothetical protein
MARPKVTVSLKEKYRKLYYALEQGGEKTRYYLTDSGQLELEWDAETGEFVPANAKQETKQVVSKQLQAQLMVFRKEFRAFAETYWDLVPESQMSGAITRSRAKQFPENWGRLDIDKNMLLRYIKDNSWKYTGSGSYASRSAVPEPLEDVFDLWMKRFTRVVYENNRAMHTYVPVPLGEPVPRHKY